MYLIFNKIFKYDLFNPIQYWYKVPQHKKNDKNIRQVISFNDKHGELYNCFINDCKFIINRDKNYLNWRFVIKPNNNYNIFEYRTNDSTLGYIVINTYKEDNVLYGQIIDIIASNEEVFCLLLNNAEDMFYKLNCKYITLLFTFSTGKKLLENMGFVTGMKTFNFVIKDISARLEEMYLTMSDSDVF
jgi:hypothetical protein